MKLALLKNPINVACEKMGAKVIYATDDFFAEKENLIKFSDPVFIADRYTERGKWMDGWESRRKRVPGHDYAVISLAAPSLIDSIEIDTAHFLGNHPPAARLEGCVSAGPVHEDAHWYPLLAKVPLGPGQKQHFDSLMKDIPFTHIRFHIYPDGGVARLRLWGRFFCDLLQHRNEPVTNLSSALMGARILGANNSFFSSASQMLRPGESQGMHDGWETRRRREPGNDWAVIGLPHAARAASIVCDTSHFKGNYPDSFSVEYCTEEIRGAQDMETKTWKPLLEKRALGPDASHSYHQLLPHDPFKAVRLSIYPDGGVARFSVLGEYVDAVDVNGFDCDKLRADWEGIGHHIGFAENLIASMPFNSMFDMLAKAEQSWHKLTDDEKKDALSRHPRIGDLSALKDKFSGNEQASTKDASDELISSLYECNQVYEHAFGWTFIVCASGQSAEDMLDCLKERLKNSKSEEWYEVVKQHAKIIALRLMKWFVSQAEGRH